MEVMCSRGASSAGANAVTVLQRPVLPSHVAFATCVHSDAHCPFLGGPQVGKGHWQHTGPTAYACPAITRLAMSAATANRVPSATLTDDLKATMTANLQSLLVPERHILDTGSSSAPLPYLAKGIRSSGKYLAFSPCRSRRCAPRAAGHSRCAHSHRISFPATVRTH